jgi:Skp family chaperone for outer membrane proteins
MSMIEADMQQHVDDRLTHLRDEMDARLTTMQIQMQQLIEMLQDRQASAAQRDQELMDYRLKHFGPRQ